MDELIGKVRINSDFYSGEDLYTDGEIEDELLAIVKNNKREDYNLIIKQRAKWPLLYHLSDLRINIIEWFPFDKKNSVLEIGSGCGAITGLLADKCSKVDCIELSKKRSEINAYRNNDKDNICIYLGNFQDVEKNLREKYDYVTLIGVFEYAENYINSEEQYIDFLKIIDKHLKENGKIIIAIENRLGMKYWAGCKEDHIGSYFEGIEGYAQTNGVKTFSKYELENICKMAGYSNIEFYYPYPDYKFALSIYSDDYLPKIGSLNDNIRNFDMDRLITFDESKAFDSILRNNMFPIFSNSFLIFVGK